MAHSCLGYLLKLYFSITLILPMSAKIMSCPLSTALSLLYLKGRGSPKVFQSQCLQTMKVAHRPAGRGVQLVSDLLEKCVLSGIKTSPSLQGRSELSAPRLVRAQGTMSAGVPGLSEADTKDSELAYDRDSPTVLT